MTSFFLPVITPNTFYSQDNGKGALEERQGTTSSSLSLSGDTVEETRTTIGLQPSTSSTPTDVEVGRL